MNRELARRAHAVLMQAVELDEPDRAAHLDAACADDPVLHRQVARLLNAMTRSDAFLETPALEERKTPLDATPFHHPESIRNYRIVRVIGIGGMATVYEAIQDQPERRVALKVLRHGLARTSAVQRFKFETEVLARLQHPGIAQIFEAGAYDDGHGLSMPYFAMEYIIDASPITSYAERAGLSLGGRLEMFAAVCDAVQHGHRNGVIHRDLKPSNILVSEHTGALTNGEGQESGSSSAGFAGHRPVAQPKIIDFGIARSLDPTRASITRESGANHLIGTLHYMSPEQCTGDPVDTRTDVYSLGVILYELVSGRLPRDLSDLPIPRALGILQEQDAPRLGSTDPRFRGDVDAIVMKAMERDPDRRYASVAALAADIRRHLRGEMVEARPPTMTYRAVRFVRRHRVLIGAMIIVLMAVVGGSVLSSVFAFRMWRESQHRIEAEQQAIKERDAARWQNYVASIAAALASVQVQEYPQARTRLELAPEEHRGWEWGFLNGMVAGDERTVPAHDDMIFALAPSPDVRSLVTAARDGRIRAWDTASGEMTAESDGLPGVPIFTVAINHDGSLAATGAEDGSIHLWDARTLEHVRLLGRHDSRVLRVAFDTGGGVISASDDGVGLRWNLDSHGNGRIIDDQPGGIHGAAPSPDGSGFVTWNRGGVVLTRDDTGATTHRFEFGGSIEQVTISSDSSLIAAGGDDGRVMIWNAQSGELVHELGSPVEPSLVRTIAFSPDGDRIAVGQGDRRISLYSMTTGQRLRILRGHAEAISGLVFDADGRRLISVSWDRTLRMWNVDEDDRLDRITDLQGHDDHVLNVDFSPDGALLASASRDGRVILWDPEIGEPLGVLKGHTDVVSDLTFSPDGRRIATGSYDRTIRLWDARTGAPDGEPLVDHDEYIWTVAFSPDSRLLASAGDDAVIRIWDVERREVIQTLEGHAARIIEVTFSPDGTMLASASRDQTVRLWNVESAEVLHDLREHESDVFAVLFSRDGKRLFTGSRDQSVRIWEVQSGRRLRTLTVEGQFVTSLAMTPDGTRLAAGSWFGEIILWDVPRLELIASFKANYRTIRDVAFSPDGRRLATGSYENTVRLFDASAEEDREQARQDAAAGRTKAEAIVDDLFRRHSAPAEAARALDERADLDPRTRIFAARTLLARSLASSKIPPP